MFNYNRREDYRVPDERLITELVSDIPFVASVVNLSHTGIYTVMPPTLATKRTQKIQLEIPVPEATESIWASGEIVYETPRGATVGYGIRFKNMSRFHHRILHDMVEQSRQKLAAQDLERQQWLERITATAPNFFGRPTAKTTQHCAPMFRRNNPKK